MKGDKIQLTAFLVGYMCSAGELTLVLTAHPSQEIKVPYCYV